MVESRQGSDPVVQKKITAAFQAFDYEGNKMVRVSNIGTIIYSLGCFPKKSDIRQFIAEVEDNKSNYVHLDKFLPAMTKVLLQNKFPLIPKECVSQAFQVLDKENKGYLTAEELTMYMTQRADGLSQEEMDMMLLEHADSENRIHGKDLIEKLTSFPKK